MSLHKQYLGTVIYYNKMRRNIIESNVTGSIDVTNAQSDNENVTDLLLSTSDRTNNSTKRKFEDISENESIAPNKVDNLNHIDDCHDKYVSTNQDVVDEQDSSSDLYNNIDQYGNVKRQRILSKDDIIRQNQSNWTKDKNLNIMTFAHESQWKDAESRLINKELKVQQLHAQLDQFNNTNALKSYIDDNYDNKPRTIVHGDGDVKNARILLFLKHPSAKETTERTPLAERGSGDQIYQHLLPYLNKVSIYVSYIIPFNPEGEWDDEPSPLIYSVFEPYVQRLISIISPKLILASNKWISRFVAAGCRHREIEKVKIPEIGAIQSISVGNLSLKLMRILHPYLLTRIDDQYYTENVTADLRVTTGLKVFTAGLNTSGGPVNAFDLMMKKKTNNSTLSSPSLNVEATLPNRDRNDVAQTRLSDLYQKMVTNPQQSKVSTPVVPKSEFSLSQKLTASTIQQAYPKNFIKIMRKYKQFNIATSGTLIELNIDYLCKNHNLICIVDLSSIEEPQFVIPDSVIYLNEYFGKDNYSMETADNIISVLSTFTGKSGMVIITSQTKEFAALMISIVLTKSEPPPYDFTRTSIHICQVLKTAHNSPSFSDISKQFKLLG